jgi:hypothetical protein
MTPFEVVYGKKPPSLPQYLAGSTPLDALDYVLTDRDNILQLLKNKLLKAQAAMKKFADQHRLPHPFKVGDHVYVKLRPHRQTSVAGQRLRKLFKRYYGPFEITRAMGPVAFELLLPPESKIHPVFHVSQLKPCTAAEIQPLSLPPTAADNNPIVQPLAIIGWRNNDNPDTQEVLVQWDSLLPKDTSWENLKELRTTFPTLHLEDKVFVEEERDVMHTPPHNSDDEEEWVDELDNLEEHSGPIAMRRTKCAAVKPKWTNDFYMQHMG